jgi:hypothetical protein
MPFPNAIGRALITLAVSGPIFALPAQAVPLVTYSWTTTSEGFGLHVDKPSSASFQVPLSDVLAGVIPQIDITNIQLTYPGLTLNAGALPSSIGLDNSAFVNPATGAFIFHDNNQGLAVVAYGGFLFSDTFLSILVDNPNAALNGVADQYNALNNGSPFAGFPTAGFWTASFPTVTATPVPAALPLFVTGLALGLLGWRKKRKVRSILLAQAIA